MERILFINSSPEKNGNTARLAAALLEGHSYEMITLADYRINSYGSRLPGDQFDEILEKIKKADVVVLGSPVYWHNLSGGLRVLL
ncbi:flavodoxin family protein, partial [Dubosiella newyorkensis]